MCIHNLKQPVLPINKTYYIFLDIDGVLNTYHHRLRQEHNTGNNSIHKWCPIACDNLLTLCQEYEAHIIISSNWKDQYELAEIRGFFENNGISPDYIIDMTPSEVERHEGAEYRGLEIQQWLNKNAPEDIPYLIIDDNSTVLPAQKEHLVQVNPQEGLANPEALAKARQILSNGRK